MKVRRGRTATKNRSHEMPWTESLYWWLIYSAVLSLSVLTLGSAAVLLCRQPARRLRIIELTLAGCLVAPLLGLIPGYPHLAITWRQVGTGPFFGEKAQLPEQRVGRKHDLSAVPRRHGLVHLSAKKRLLPTSLIENIDLPPSVTHGTPVKAWNVTSWLVGLYLLGVAIGVAWWLVGMAALMRIVWTAQAAPPHCRRLLAQIAGRRSDRVRLLTSHLAKQPFAATLWWPILLGRQLNCPFAHGIRRHRVARKPMRRRTGRPLGAGARVDAYRAAATSARGSWPAWFGCCSSISRWFGGCAASFGSARTMWPTPRPAARPPSRRIMPSFSPFGPPPDRSTRRWSAWAWASQVRSYIGGSSCSSRTGRWKAARRGSGPSR